MFLEKFGAKTGSNYSYGMFDGHVEVAGEMHHEKVEKNRFKHPLYNQMQTDGKNLFIGDDEGKIYCLPLDKDAYVSNSDITDPTNTFIKNPAVFKWTFNDKEFTFQKNNQTFLKEGVLYTACEKSGSEESAIFAIHTKNGELKWKRIIAGDIIHWTLINNKIIGHTENTIFQFDVTNENFTEIKDVTKPLSNIELLDKGTFIYITEKGIETLDILTKKQVLLFAKDFDANTFNNMQIQYISN